MNTLTVELHNRQQAWAAIKGQVFPFLSEVMQGGHRWVLSIGPRKRTKAQNRRYWGNGVLAQVAAQATINGRLYSTETWHEQFKRMFIGVEELPNAKCRGRAARAFRRSSSRSSAPRSRPMRARNLA